MGVGSAHQCLINHFHWWGYVNPNWNTHKFLVLGLKRIVQSCYRNMFYMCSNLKMHQQWRGTTSVWRACFCIAFTYRMLNCSFRTAQAGLWSPKFHFALVNPIAHYPVHCIRPLISPFNSYSVYLLGRKRGFLINLLTAINKGTMQLCSVDLISSMKAEVRDIINIQI